MALSNTLKEPRREITETAIGVGVFGVFLYADYIFATWLISNIPHETGDKGIRILVTVIFMILGFVLTMILGGLLVVLHALGDDICNKLAQIGADPRPKTRYK